MENRETTPFEQQEENKAMIRHDLKGTLNRIYALCRLIQMTKPELSGDQADYLKKIEAECKAGTEKINQAIPKRHEPNH